jgi:hypothetical protein
MASEGKKPSKHALLEVPNFNGAPTDGGGMSSYLILGMPPEPKEDQNFEFGDDARQREGCPRYIPPGVRQAETARLFTKGGWFDHSDGNRITTTRGDKVEVIYGNYNLVVLGRRQFKSGWDASGGHALESGITFAGDFEIKWVQDYGGTWKVKQTSVKGDVDTTYVGDTIDKYYGLRKESVTGSETPCAPDEAVSAKDAPYKYNPVIIDRTWAESIESYTGSAALPVPLISDETWVEKLISRTYAGSTTDETVVEATIRSTTRARTITDETTAAKIVSTTRADVEDTTHGNSSSDTYGNSLSVTHGFDLTLVYGITNEIMLGGSNEITIGEQGEIMVGGVLDISIAGKFSVDIGGSFECDIGPKIEMQTSETKVVLVESSVSAMKNEVHALRSIFSPAIRLF